MIFKKRKPVHRSEIARHARDFSVITVALRPLNLPNDFAVDDVPDKVIAQLQKDWIDLESSLASYKIFQFLFLRFQFYCGSAAVDMLNTATEPGNSLAIPSALLRYVRKMCPDITEKKFPYPQSEKAQETVLIYFAALCCKLETEIEFISSCLDFEKNQLFKKLLKNIKCIESVTQELYNERRENTKNINEIKSRHWNETFIEETESFSVEFDRWLIDNQLSETFEALKNRMPQLDLPLDDVINLGLLKANQNASH